MWEISCMNRHLDAAPCRERHLSYIPRKNNGTSIYTGPGLQVLHTNMLYEYFCKTTCKIYWNLVNVTYQDLNSQYPSLLSLNLQIHFNKKANKESSHPNSVTLKIQVQVYNAFSVRAVSFKSDLNPKLCLVAVIQEKQLIPIRRSLGHVCVSLYYWVI